MDQWWGKGVPGVAQCNSTLSKASRTGEFLPFEISAVAFLIDCQTWEFGVLEFQGSLYDTNPRCNALVLGKFIKMTIHLYLFDPPKKLVVE